MFFYAGPRNLPQPVEFPYVGRVETGERRASPSVLPYGGDVYLMDGLLEGRAPMGVNYGMGVVGAVRQGHGRTETPRSSTASLYRCELTHLGQVGGTGGWNYWLY